MLTRQRVSGSECVKGTFFIHYHTSVSFDFRLSWLQGLIEKDNMGMNFVFLFIAIAIISPFVVGDESNKRKYMLIFADYFSELILLILSKVSLSKNS